MSSQAAGSTVIFMEQTITTLVGGRYRLGPQLGAGANGRVWLARDEKLLRFVAAKEVPRATAPAPGASRREAAAAARASHRNVVRIHDFVADDAGDRDWIIMEALSGDSLATVLRRHGRIHADETRYVAEHLRAALRAVHAAGLVHGDVKPANVHLCDDGRVVLTDFGLTAPSRRTGGAFTGPIAGSLPYLAPEILLDGVYSPASDLYALGVTLFTAATGRLPAGNRAQILLLPPDLRQMIERLLSHDPARRAGGRVAGGSRESGDGLPGQWRDSPAGRPMSRARPTPGQR